MIFQVRYPSHPEDFKHYTTERIRKEFHIGDLMIKDEISMIYSHFDRMIIGGCVPVKKKLKIEAAAYQMTGNFLDRRELGIINTGGKGRVETEQGSWILENRDALYVGLGVKTIVLSSEDPAHPAYFYYNSALAHKKFPSKKIEASLANPVHLGSADNSNERVLYQYIVPGLADTCQLMMGITTVKTGSSWNTMPCHRHELRMEAYFYFDIPDGQAVCHLMGEPGETRPVWLKNNEAVISPSWSIHTASGTSTYSFIWGMAGSDSQMDPVKTEDLK